MRNGLVVVMGLGISGCGGTQEPPRNPPTPDPEPKMEHTVADAPLPETGRLNPQTTDGLLVVRSRDGCMVRLPPDPNSPPGFYKTEAIDCPEVMNDPAWESCVDGEISRKGPGDCTCFISGNPPPPSTKVLCPGDVTPMKPTNPPAPGNEKNKPKPPPPPPPDADPPEPPPPPKIHRNPPPPSSENQPSRIPDEF